MSLILNLFSVALI